MPAILERIASKDALRQSRILWLFAAIIGSSLAPGQDAPRKAQPPPRNAQQQPAPPPTFRVQSNLVVVDVVVRDRKGSLVRDLKKEDFTLFEDNVPQTLVNFSLEEIPVAEEKPAEQIRTVVAAPAPAINYTLTPKDQRKREDLEDKRIIILYFDLSSLETEDLIRSVTTAEDFIKRKSTPHDLIAVATYQSTLEVVQDLTNDQETLLSVLKQINPAEQAAESEVADDADSTDSTDTSEDVYVPDDVQFNIFNTDRRLAALEQLAKGYREFPERKSLILFAGGVRTTGSENQAQIRSTVDAANQSNMSIYTVDSRGLTALPPGGDASRGSRGGRGLFSGSSMRRQASSFVDTQETLSTLAEDTGGAAFFNTNELAPVFTKVLADTQCYYVLGYYPSNFKEDGRFRKIRVEVALKDVKLQHRPGYFASKQFTRLTKDERSRQLEDALSVDRPFSDLPFILDASCFKQDGANTIVPMSVQLAGEGIKFRERKDQRQAEFEFIARVSDPKGRVAGIQRDTVTIRLPLQRAEKIKTGKILYSTGFTLRPGDYRLKFLIRDNETGRLGSFERPLEVPVLDGKSLQTSTIVLGSRLVDAVEAPGVARREGPPPPPFFAHFKLDPLTIGKKKLVPSIGNVFLNRQTVYIYFQVYGAAENPATRKPSLHAFLTLLRNNARVRESQPQTVEEWLPERKDGVPVAMAVPLKGLEKGDYSLQIHIRDEMTDTNIYRRVPVVIE